MAEENVNSLLFELLTLNTFPAKFKGLKKFNLLSKSRGLYNIIIYLNKPTNYI